MISSLNSVRLQRLSKTIASHDTTINSSHYEPKQALKLPALNSITLGVKHNDLSFISGRQLNKLRQDPEDTQDLEFQYASLSMNQIRKKYDSVHKEKGFRDSSISKLKQEKKKFTIIEGQLIEKKQNGKEKVEQLQNNLEKYKNLFASAQAEKKVLENMRKRLKSDKVILDQRKFNLQKELNFLRKQMQVMQIDKNQICQTDDRAKKILKKYSNQLQAEKAQRLYHLQSITKMVNKKDKAQKFNNERTIEVRKIAERAMQDKDEELLLWQKLYLSNKFMAKILRDKMDRQMRKFSTVETAFKIIKIATGVSDADSLVYKFLNKEKAYGDLLGKIADNEKMIVWLKKEREQMMKEHKELLAEKETIDGCKKIEVNVEVQIKVLNEMEEKKKKFQLERQKLREWVIKSIKKINSFQEQKKGFSKDRDHKSIVQNFISYLKQIDSEISKAQQSQKPQETHTKQLTTPIKKNLIRIKQSSQPQQDSQTEATYQESNMIQLQRQQLVHKNEQFMKEVRTKHEEKKKALAQAMMPKKKGPDPAALKKNEQPQ